ncbi:MAG: lysine--tRNA ligase [Candidatus Dojkabacteria bacterium]|nr:lysine--tRNA ligase [Candidatus Dojkabacteria bacterium]
MAMIDTIRKDRMEKVKRLRELGFDPYPSDSLRTHASSEVVKGFNEFSGKTVTVSGRLMSWRDFGKLIFARLRDESGDIQLMLRKENLSQLWSNRNLFDVGDFVDATGVVTKSNTGEVSVEVRDLRMLAKSLRPLPEKWVGLKDDDIRFRRRYLDFLVNPASREKIQKRARLLRFLREFLWNKGFIEIENPSLETNPSGAEARPFITHINAYDMDVYLRICIGELWQKMSTIGGFEKVFEIGRAYRNEGVDAEHNPEFSMLEFYWAYATIEDNIKLHQELFSEVAKAVTGDYVFEYHGKKVDLTPPIPTIRYSDLFEEHTGLKLDSFSDLMELKKAGKSIGADIDDEMGWSSTIDQIYKQRVRPNVFGPVFLVDYPYVLTPLAKRSQKDERFIQMSQMVIDSMEMCRIYGELNDPIDQRERFGLQVEAKEKGDDQTWSADYEFVEAMEYGMPPQTGSGIGIDRLAKLLADAESLREVIAYPIMKPDVSAVSSRSSNKKEFKNKKMIAVIRDDLTGWPVTNAVGHISAYLGAQIGKENLLSRPVFNSKSGEPIPADSQYPLVVLSAGKEDLYKLFMAAEEKGLVYIAFVREMIDFADDDELEKALAGQKREDMDYLGVGMFGERKVIDALTEGMPLWK